MTPVQPQEAECHANVAMWLPGVELGRGQAAGSTSRASMGLCLRTSMKVQPRKAVLGRLLCLSKKEEEKKRNAWYRSPERSLILLLSHLFLHLPHAPQVLHQQGESQDRDKNWATHAPVGSPATSCLQDRTLQIRVVWQICDRAASAAAP